MEEALITQLIVVEDIEPFIIDAQEHPIEFQIRMPGDNWDTVDILIGGKVLFRADWTGNLLKFFKRAVEMWPEE